MNKAKPDWVAKKLPHFKSQWWADTYLGTFFYAHKDMVFLSYQVQACSWTKEYFKK